MKIILPRTSSVWVILSIGTMKNLIRLLWNLENQS